LKENIFIVSIFDAPTIKEYAAFLEKNYPKALAAYFGNNSHDIENQVQQHKILKQQDFYDFKNTIPLIKTSLQSQPSKNPPAIFILAPPRSGTSLLRLMLAGHPRLFAANELQIPCRKERKHIEVNLHCGKKD